jgi:arylformamidase
MAQLSADFIERGYNNRAACPDHPLWFERWAAESEGVRKRADARLDLRYGAAPRQTLDIFAAAQPRGALLFIHGGYWRALDKSQHSFVAGPLIDCGVSVAVMNYDLCPAVGIPDIVEECRQAVVWLAQHGAEHGMPMKRLVVAGHSAGGHLVAMLFATDWARYGVSPQVLAAGVAISGVFDLEPLVQVSFNADLRLDTATARAMSPAHMSSRLAAPLLLAVGARETSEFIRQTLLLWDAWPACRPARASGPLRVPNKHHFSILSELGNPASELSKSIGALFIALAGRDSVDN